MRYTRYRPRTDIAGQFGNPPSLSVVVIILVLRSFPIRMQRCSGPVRARLSAVGVYVQVVMCANVRCRVSTLESQVRPKVSLRPLYKARFGEVSPSPNATNIAYMAVYARKES